MIVKCEQCQTRFKIPDEKVTDKGVKVRCTKCGHTFRVTRESAASPSGTSLPAVPPPPGATPSDSGFDPFERFGTAPEPPKGQSTKPGLYAEGIEASKVPLPPPAPPAAPWNAPDSGVGEEFFQETTRVIPLQVPPEARPPVPSLPPLPGVPSVAPAVPSAGARGLPTPAPLKPPLPGARPLGGAAPAAPRTLAPPAMPVPGVAGPASSARPGVKALEPLPPAAPIPAPDDLFSEFFANPAGGPAPAAPLPKAPVPLPPAPAPAQARPAPASPSFGPPDDDPFGSVSGDLGEQPQDLGPAPEFDPTAMFSDPAPSPAPVAPPRPPAMGRPTPLPTASAPPGGLRRPPMPSTPAPVASRLPPSPALASLSTPAPVARMAPPAMPPPAAPAPAALGDDPFGPSNFDLGGPPADEFGFGAAPAAAPVPMPAPAPAPVDEFGFGAAPAPADEFGFGAAPVPAPVDEFGFGAAPAAAPVPMPAPASSAGPLAFADEDPFGSQGMDLGGPPEAPAAAAPDPFAPPSADPFAAPSADEFGPSFGGTPAQARAAPAAPSAGFAPPGPMDFGMVGDEQFPPDSGPGAAGMPDPFAAPAGGMDDPFGAPAPAGGMDDPFAAPAGGMDDPFGAPAPAGGMDDPFGAPAPAGGMDDPFGAPAQPGGMADPFAAAGPGPGGGIPDPFAAAEPAFSPTMTGRQRIGPAEGFLTQTDTGHQTLSPTDTGRQLLDIPSHEGAEQVPIEDPGAAGSRELIDLPSQQPEAGGPPRPVPTLASPGITRPAGRPADMGIPERRKVSAAQAVTGQVAYLTIAAGLLLALTAVGGVYMKEGRVDASALSPGHLIKLLTPSKFVMRDVTNGLYDTRGTTPLFYVRGEVENRSSQPAKVKVTAGLYDGGQRVKSAEGLAGMTPSPEELHAITSAEAATELRTRLDAGAAVVAPGKRAPFTLVLQEYPKDLSTFRLKVTMEPVGEEEAKP
jgi:predicted Zn finger-like uncharacterized protein